MNKLFKLLSYRHRHHRHHHHRLPMDREWERVLVLEWVLE